MLAWEFNYNDRNSNTTSDKTGTETAKSTDCVLRFFHHKQAAESQWPNLKPVLFYVTFYDVQFFPFGICESSSEVF